MKLTIYLDILIATNIFINYFLLLAVTKFLAIEPKRVRLITASCLGAAYSFIIFAPQINPWLSLLIKLIMSATIVLIAFKISSIKSFIRILACFYLTSFGFVGIMLLIWYFVAPQGMVMKNSVVYFNISPIVLILLTVVCYFVVRIISRITGQQEVKESICTIQIESEGNVVECTAKIDTGSNLTEPFSHFPVVVAQYEKIKSVIPLSLMKMLNSVSISSNSMDMNFNFRMVPFHSLSGEGILPAYLPDKLIIHTKENTIEVKNVYIAVCTAKLADGVYDALLNPVLLTLGEQTSLQKH